MMIVDVDVNFFLFYQILEFPDTSRLSGIDQNETANFAEFQISYFGKIKEIEGGLHQELSEIMFLRTWKHHDRLWI